jgi:hypothetical protein
MLMCLLFDGCLLLCRVAAPTRLWRTRAATPTRLLTGAAPAVALRAAVAAVAAEVVCCCATLQLGHRHSSVSWIVQLHGFGVCVLWKVTSNMNQNNQINPQ